MTSNASPISVGYSALGIADDSKSDDVRGVAAAAAFSGAVRARDASPDETRDSEVG